MKIQGKVTYKRDSGYEKTLMNTLFNKVDPCQRPDMIVQPANVDDIVAVTKFAKTSGHKISICSGGHSWSANHVRNNSILIDMSGFNQYTINKEGMTAFAGPGVSGSDLLVKLFKQGLFFPAGHCRGVCLGGYLLQGGFGWNGRKLGMACESVSGIDMVTANGEYVHASPFQNADLYFAARGSGGGFFGVVVRYHLKLYKRPEYCGITAHFFKTKYLEDVFNWAYEVGPTVPSAVEFQMLMARKTLGFLGPGIQVLAPVFADTKEELNDAIGFMKNSPIKSKAFVHIPFMKSSINLSYSLVMKHYPDNYYWGVDNMWTGASIEQLMPYIKQIAETLPPSPSHMLWLNWQPPAQRQEMAFSMEDKIYIALYGAWKSQNGALLNGKWASGIMQDMSHLATGIQLADEGLHKRTAQFITGNNLQKLDVIRSERDSGFIFNTWHSRPKAAEYEAVI